MTFFFLLLIALMIAAAVVWIFWFAYHYFDLEEFSSNGLRLSMLGFSIGSGRQNPFQQSGD